MANEQIGAAGGPRRTRVGRAMVPRPPSPATFAALLDVAVDQLTGASLIEAIAEAEMLLSRMSAVQVRLMAEFAKPGRAGDVSALVEKLCDVGGKATQVDGSVDLEILAGMVEDRAAQLAAAEVGAALAISPLAARGRVDSAVELTQQLPATWTALFEGAIDRTRARIIAERTFALPGEARSVVEQLALRLAGHRTPRRLRDLIDRAVIAVDPEAAHRRTEAARNERGIEHLPADDSMGLIKALLPAEDAATVFMMIDLLAQAIPDRERTLNQRRADALSDLARDLLADGHVDISGRPLSSTAFAAEASSNVDQVQAAGRQHEGEADSSLVTPPRSPKRRRPEPGDSSTTSRRFTRHGRQVHLTVTMAASTLAGLDRLPGELAGSGAITAELATMLARSAGTLTAVVVDSETGSARAIGATVYRPRQALIDHVTTAADMCRFPGCRVRAESCDIDHREPFDRQNPARGGLTTSTNTDPLCRAHHLIKENTTWASIPDGKLGIRWTSPTGHSYLDPAREFTLPGEWSKTVDDGARASIGVADGELADLCATPPLVPDRNHPYIALRMQIAEREFAECRAVARRRVGRLATWRENPGSYPASGQQRKRQSLVAAKPPVSVSFDNLPDEPPF